MPKMHNFTGKDSISPIPPPPPPILPLGNFSAENSISPSILLIIVILAVVFFISGLLHLLVRYLFSRQSSRDSEDLDDVTALQGQLQQLFDLHDAGVDQSFIDTLPVFLYKAIIGLKNPFDCAVCLCEFEAEDKLRLLPKCSHAFHLECIDTWLLSHSTCPLCRCSLLPDFNSNSGCSPSILLLLESGRENSREIAPNLDSSAAVTANTSSRRRNVSTRLSTQGEEEEFGSSHVDMSTKEERDVPVMLGRSSKSINLSTHMNNHGEEQESRSFHDDLSRKPPNDVSAIEQSFIPVKLGKSSRTINLSTHLSTQGGGGGGLGFSHDSAIEERIVSVKLGRSSRRINSSSHLSTRGEEQEFGSSHDDLSSKPRCETSAIEERIVPVKLGKFRNVDDSVEKGEGTGSNSNVDERRCFSMGSFQYVLDDSSVLQVAIKPSQSTRRHRLAMSECGDSRREGFKGFDATKITARRSEVHQDVDVRTAGIITSSKRDSFSVSKIWLQTSSSLEVDSSRRAVSFRLPLDQGPIANNCKAKQNSRTVSEIDVSDWESHGSELGLDVEVGSCTSLEPLPARIPSFARRTLQWLVGRQNKVVHSSSTNHV